MGKPSTSCFKIISCSGGDAADEDDLAHEEVKDSSDKRRWSFRKRSSRHQVLSTTVISEPISICSSKQSQELSSSLHSSKNSLPEKPKIQAKQIETSPLPSDIVTTEEAPLSLSYKNATAVTTEAPPSLSNKSATAVTTEAPPLSNKCSNPVGPALNESGIIIVQAAIRGFLARKKLHRLKSVVKLQAAVRGHLVRSQAIGTLRCIQAIIRMQALVRARHARQFQGKELKKANKTSTKKLLSNGLARQLLETTPTTKAIYIKCDPSKSDSAWKWLERWMVVASLEIDQEHEKSFDQGTLELEGDDKVANTEPEKDIKCAISPVLSDTMLASAQLVLTDDGKTFSATEKIDQFEFQTPSNGPDNSFTSSLNNSVENLEVKEEPLNLRIEDYTDAEMVNEDSLDSVSENKTVTQNISSEMSVDILPDKNECVETSNHSTERASSETLENDEKKSIIGSRKTCNPAFIAAQSKFEVLSLMSTAGRSTCSANQDVASKSKTESNSIQVDSFTRTNEAISADNSMLQDSRVQAAVSECGTEISISSTLDSLDRSEMEGGEIVLEIGGMEKQSYSIITDTEKSLDLPKLDGKANGSAVKSGINEPQRPDGGDQVEPTMPNADDPVNLAQADQNPVEPTTSDAQSHLEGTIEQARSPEGTPRSHATVPDLHGTPSSDISVSTRKSKKDNNMPSHRQTSHLVGKRSPSTPNNDSGGISSTENLSKDSKTSKRRNSFATAKTDHVDQEPRLSSSNSLPGYMQATVSARAKAHANTSQKSSPDLLDNQPKKRHSLPIENGKQSSSPRMQRSASQAQQSAKINGVHSPHNSAGPFTSMRRVEDEKYDNGKGA
ncbi:protein IQ-DOMAIN 32-like [Canna indica]|uniref:Protein IQ-DOMAIN 32-like n=1 Tax=Canna indica TaxID=4628 RepID=A0AAQ3L2N5_9LILI|nr:protein IQ-DOMAIN 32-like [Canna indica]